MSKKNRGRFRGDPVTYQLPSPAGGAQLETFVPWTLVKRDLKKRVITPLGGRRNSCLRPPGSGAPDRLRGALRWCWHSDWRATGNVCWASRGWRRWPRSPRPQAWA